jgi:hypothetical protein
MFDVKDHGYRLCGSVSVVLSRQSGRKWCNGYRQHLGGSGQAPVENAHKPH